MTPVIEPCIVWFGARSRTFESILPIDKTGIGCADRWNAFKRQAGVSQTEKYDLFAGKARRVDRLA